MLKIMRLLLFCVAAFVRLVDAWSETSLPSTMTNLPERIDSPGVLLFHNVGQWRGGHDLSRKAKRRGDPIRPKMEYVQQKKVACIPSIELLEPTDK